MFKQSIKAFFLKEKLLTYKNVDVKTIKYSNIDVNKIDENMLKAPLRM